MAATTSEINSNVESGDEDDGMSGAEVAGIAIACIVVGGAIGALLFSMATKARASPKATGAEMTNVVTSRA